jgi:hypothetical protein
VTHEERLAGLDRCDLTNVIELARKKLVVLQDADKEEYYVVSDEWMNIGFFRKTNLEGAIKLMTDVLRGGVVKERGDYVQIQLQRWYADEVEDLDVSKDTVKENDRD